MPAAWTSSTHDQSSPKLTETSTGRASIAASSSAGSRRTAQSMRPIPKLDACLSRMTYLGFEDLRRTCAPHPDHPESACSRDRRGQPSAGHTTHRRVDNRDSQTRRLGHAVEIASRSPPWPGSRHGDSTVDDGPAFGTDKPAQHAGSPPSSACSPASALAIRCVRRVGRHGPRRRTRLKDGPNGSTSCSTPGGMAWVSPVPARPDRGVVAAANRSRPSWTTTSPASAAILWARRSPAGMVSSSQIGVVRT